jgi:lysophospholipid acyltransferase (LPLAT)-like uncharacterized protein
MKLIRPIVHSESLRVVLCWLGSLYIRFVHVTSSWQVVNGHIPAAFWDSGKPFILCMWHGRFLMFPCAWPKSKRIHMLISQHRDGQIISRTVGHFGLATIAGSSSRGGSQALRGLLAMLKAGECIGITPDGPRGPRMRATDGVVAIARLSGVPVIPIAINSSRRKVLSTWDRFVVSLPFSRGVFMWGEPIEIPRDADKDEQEAARLYIEETLTNLCHDADAMFGHDKIEPHSGEVKP